MSKQKITMASIALLYAVSANAQVCTTSWEYKIIRVQDADELIAKDVDGEKAAKKLKNKLNRLGAKGWDIASSHRLVEREDLVPPENINALPVRTGTIVELQPSIVLMKRATTTCE